MKALTLWRPWPWAIFHGGTWAKRIENRTWKPPPGIIGQRIVLHAGKTFDKGAVDGVLDRVATYENSSRVLPVEAGFEGLIGVCTVTGWVDNVYDAAVEAGQGQERWWMGPFAWVLTDVRAFPEPIRCKGAMGLWAVPPWAQRLVDQVLT